MERRTAQPIIRGTTPTIMYAFNAIDVSSITAAYLVVKQNGERMIVTDKTQAPAADGSLTWKLAQADTLKLKHGVPALICCDWLLADGTRGIGRSVEASVTSSAIDEVIG